jgi:hypothetical protein
LTAWYVLGTVLALCSMLTFSLERLTFHFADGKTVTQTGEATIKMTKVFVKTHWNQAWWCTPIILGLRRLRQED